MKAELYITNDNGFMRKKELKYSTDAVNGVSIKKGEKCVCDSFMGFGVALTGSSLYNLSLMDKGERSEFLKSMYSDDGIDMSVGRICVGSADYSKEIYSYDDLKGDIKEDKELKFFSVGRDDEYIIPMIKEILEIKKDIFLFSSPWSPPGWMKTGGSMCGGYMREKYLDSYAKYYVKFLQEYEKRGISIKALTPQNEPEADQVGKFPACIWHPETEAKFIEILYKKLRDNGMNQEIWMYDHNFAGWKRVLWTLDNYPDIKKYVSDVAFHYYSGDASDVEKIRKVHPEIGYHFTGGGPRLYDNYAEDFCKWSYIISNSLTHGLKSFTGWNLMLDETGGPNVGHCYCGGLVTRNSQSGLLSYSGQYKAISHFSKFIKRGAKIYKPEISGEILVKSFGFPNSSLPIGVSIAENEDKSIVLNLSNANDEKTQINFEHEGENFYIELLKNSVATAVFSK